MSEKPSNDVSNSVVGSMPIRDGETKKLEKTLRSYREICVEKEHRKAILKDTSFLNMLTQCMTDNRPTVMKYLIEILLLLTERKDDAAYLATVEGLVKAIGLAQEGPFSPTDVKQLITIATRIQAIEKKKLIPTSGDVADSRRFIARTNRQIIFEIDDMNENLRTKIETLCISRLGRRGLISVYCDVGKFRVVLRTTQALDAKTVSEVLFDCGCELVTQLTKIDGIEERFPMYASEREERRAETIKDLPDYLEENLDHPFDPSTTLVTKAHAQQSGWLTSVANYVKFW